MIPPPEPQPDELQVTFEPDEVTAWIDEQLNDAGFSPENSWLLATRHWEVDWHTAERLIKTGRWTELEILKVLI